jgi:hypothetical protein
VPLEAIVLARALRRLGRPGSIAFLGVREASVVLDVLRWLRAPQEGGVVLVVEAPRHAVNEAGWNLRGLGLAAEDWLADPMGARVDAIVAWHALEPRDAEKRWALLDRVPRRASSFVALERDGVFGEGELTGLWPAWHSCALRERRGRCYGHLLEARSL